MTPCGFLRAGCVIALALALLATPAAAAPRLDARFGDGGIARAPFNDRRDSLFGALRPFRQADGKVLVAAQPDPDHGQTFDVLLARFTRAGALDRSFGRRGRLRLSSYVPRQFTPLSLSADRKGRIIMVGAVGGYAYFAAAPSSLEVIRLLPDGSPDRSFGTNGLMVWSPPWRTADEWMDPGPVLRQPDGRLLIGATVYGARLRGSPGYSPRAVLVRLQPNGSLDHSFGQGGFAEVAFDGGYLGYWAWLADGRLASVVGRNEGPGPAATPGTTAFWLHTFAPADSSETPLRPTGSVRLGHDLLDYVAGVVADRDGGLLVIGEVFIQDGRDSIPVVRRILPDGSLDASYGRRCAQPPPRLVIQGAVATRDGGALMSAATSLPGAESRLVERDPRGCLAGRPVRLPGFTLGPPLLLPGRRAVVAASYSHGRYDTDLALIRIRR